MVAVNGLDIEFHEGMSLSEALAKAGVDTGAALLVTVNGVYVEKSGAGSFALIDTSEIRVMPILSGG